MCTDSGCAVMACAASLNAELLLDVHIVFVNKSISMAVGPSPNEIQLSRMESESDMLATVIICQNQGDRPPCTIMDNYIGRISFAGTFPDEIDFVINDIGDDSVGTYVTTAHIVEPSGTSRILTKTFIGQFSGAGIRISGVGR